jgi:hypothetical protein
MLFAGYRPGIAALPIILDLKNLKSGITDGQGENNMADARQEYTDIINRIQNINNAMLQAERKTPELGPEDTLLKVWEDNLREAAAIEQILSSPKNRKNPIYQEILKTFLEDTVGPLKMNYEVSLKEHRAWVQKEKDRFRKEEMQDRIKAIDTRLKALRGPKAKIGQTIQAVKKIAESFAGTGAGTEAALAEEPAKMEDIFRSLVGERKGLEEAVESLEAGQPKPVI